MEAYMPVVDFMSKDHISSWLKQTPVLMDFHRSLTMSWIGRKLHNEDSLNPLMTEHS